MAINPMQRRTRNSFLIGLLIGLIVVIAVIVLFITKIKYLNQEKEELKAKVKQVYVASSYIESGEEVGMDSFRMEEVQTTIDNDELIDIYDEFESEYIDEEGNVIENKKIMKIAVPEGTIITKSMLEDSENVVTNSTRLQEFNMIVLPTLLETGDYVDIRLRLPEGEDYIVVSKKKVEESTTDTIWIKLSEEEILTMGNAIVEAYMINGSKLYATAYTEPGRQEATEPTYPVSQNVLTLINNSPNILENAKNALYNRYTSQSQVEQRNNKLNMSLPETSDEKESAVEAGLQEEITKLQEAREEYIGGLSN